MSKREPFSILPIVKEGTAVDTSDYQRHKLLTIFPIVEAKTMPSPSQQQQLIREAENRQRKMTRIHDGNEEEGVVVGRRGDLISSVSDEHEKEDEDQTAPALSQMQKGEVSDLKSTLALLVNRFLDSDDFTALLRSVGYKDDDAFDQYRELLHWCSGVVAVAAVEGGRGGSPPKPFEGLSGDALWAFYRRDESYATINEHDLSAAGRRLIGVISVLFYHERIALGSDDEASIRLHDGNNEGKGGTVKRKKEAFLLPEGSDIKVSIIIGSFSLSVHSLHETSSLIHPASSTALCMHPVVPR